MRTFVTLWKKQLFASLSRFATKKQSIVLPLEHLPIDKDIASAI